MDLGRARRRTVACRTPIVVVSLRRIASSSAAAAGLSLAVDLPESPLWVRGDPTRLAQVMGNRDELVGKVQERYGITREAAERQVDEWAQHHQEFPQA